MNTLQYSTSILFLEAIVTYILYSIGFLIFLNSFIIDLCIYHLLDAFYITSLLYLLRTDLIAS